LVSLAKPDVSPTCKTALALHSSAVCRRVFHFQFGEIVIGVGGRNTLSGIFELRVKPVRLGWRGRFTEDLAVVVVKTVLVELVGGGGAEGLVDGFFGCFYLEDCRAE